MVNFTLCRTNGAGNAKNTIYPIKAEITDLEALCDALRHDYVCVDALGNLISPQYLTTHFPVILRRLGLKRIRFHDLRHSCASLMLSNGVPMKMIQDWLGHSSMSTTANIYSHVDSASKLASAQVIGNVLSIEKGQE